jgi:hypothetical protein
MSYELPQHCPHEPTSIDNPPKAYDLDITKYTFEEILGIFHLSPSMSLSDLKRARKKVLMMHPDKSKLPPDYYLFYKKAFDIVVAYYGYTHQVEESSKKMEEGAHNQYTYVAPNETEETERTRTTVQDLSKGGGGAQFNAEFNRLFDEIMRPVVDDSKNEWFRSQDPILTAEGQVTQANMGSVFEHLKKQQQAQGLVRYTGVKDMRHNMGAKLYGEDDGDQDDVYVSSDPFSKLRFDDLRKVHKDQTIFGVSDTGFEKVNKYRTKEEYEASRSQAQMQYTSLSGKELAEIRAREAAEKARLEKKRQDDMMKGLEFAKKQKAIMANFMRLSDR